MTTYTLTTSGGRTTTMEAANLAEVVKANSRRRTAISVYVGGFWIGVILAGGELILAV